MKVDSEDFVKNDKFVEDAVKDLKSLNIRVVDTTQHKYKGKVTGYTFLVEFPINSIFQSMPGEPYFQRIDYKNGEFRYNDFFGKTIIGIVLYAYAEKKKFFEKALAVTKVLDEKLKEYKFYKKDYRNEGG